jgi:Putative beta-lactamase-inhibitor-like, PepSY-like
MKKIWIISLGALVVACGENKTKEIKTIKEVKVIETGTPKAVVSAFEAKYPKATLIKYVYEGNKEYEVEFKDNGTEKSAVFTSEGKFKEVEAEVKTTELPADALAYCTETYPNLKLTEVAKIVGSDNKVQFEAELTDQKGHFDLIFDEAGKFIRKAN